MIVCGGKKRNYDIKKKSFKRKKKGCVLVRAGKISASVSEKKKMELCHYHFRCNKIFLRFILKLEFVVFLTYHFLKEVNW